MATLLTNTTFIKNMIIEKFWIVFGLQTTVYEDKKIFNTKEIYFYHFAADCVAYRSKTQLLNIHSQEECA